MESPAQDIQENFTIDENESTMIPKEQVLSEKEPVPKDKNH